MASFGSPTGTGKLDAVSRLLDILSQDLEAKNLTIQQRDVALEELKIYGRDPVNSDPIFTKKGIEILAKHAFNHPSSSTSRGALRVLCNAMLLKPATRRMFLDLGFEAPACDLLRNDHRDDEFLVSRLILLTTYEPAIDLQKLVDENQLAGSIIVNLSRHAERLGRKVPNRANTDPMEEMALVESLKLLFNITTRCEKVDSSPAIPHLVDLLCKLEIPSPRTPLDPPLGLVVNALMNINFEGESIQASLYPVGIVGSATDRAIELLDLSMKSYHDNELEAAVLPLVCLICRLYRDAPESTRKLIRDKILPTDQDRQGVLGQGESLPARLLKNWTNPLAPGFRSAVAELFFEMSDQDATTFVNNVGYGFASGFLFQRNIPVPETVTEGQGTNAASGGRAVNPITGQFIDAENGADLPEMTDEEKEREAERLFVLFERLNRLGVISVQNPIQQAVQEGRFEELPDDAPDDLD